MSDSYWSVICEIIKALQTSANTYKVLAVFFITVSDYIAFSSFLQVSVIGSNMPHEHVEMFYIVGESQQIQ